MKSKLFLLGLTAALITLCCFQQAHAYYDPETGTYITRDPVDYQDGMNVYTYVHGNPVNHIDPLGLDENIITLDTGAKKTPPAFRANDGNYAKDLNGSYSGIVSVAPIGDQIDRDLQAHAMQQAERSVKLQREHPLLADLENIIDVGSRYSAIGEFGEFGAIEGAAGLPGKIPNVGKAGEITAEGRTTLYRAVGPAELADIQANNALRNLGSAEGKYFTTSAESASSYAKQAVKGFGDPAYTIIQTKVPNSIFEGLTPATVDRGIPAWVIPNNRLPGLTPQVLDAMPIPHQ